MYKVKLVAKRSFVSLLLYHRESIRQPDVIQSESINLLCHVNSIIEFFYNCNLTQNDDDDVDDNNNNNNDNDDDKNDNNTDNNNDDDDIGQ